MTQDTLSSKRKGFVKIPEDKLHDKLKDGYYYGRDIKNFIQKVEEIVKRRCLGTSANCYEINKEIRKNAGDKLLK